MSGIVESHLLQPEIGAVTGGHGAEGVGAMIAEHRDDAGTAPAAPVLLTTTYFGHQISIEPVEWGFLTFITEPSSGVRLIAVARSAMKGLEDAFDVIDDRVGRPLVG